MPGRLEGKVAVITGAASGIGRESARRFAEEGAGVCVADLDPRGKEVAAAVDGLYLRVDVTDPDDVRRMYREAADYFGHLDVLFNNAGISPPRTAPSSRPVLKPGSGSRTSTSRASTCAANTASHTCCRTAAAR